MKNIIKIVILILAIVGVIMLFTSCKKEDTVETEYKGRTYFRVESVAKDGTKSHSEVTHLNIQ